MSPTMLAIPVPSPLVEHRACRNCGQSVNDQGLSLDPDDGRQSRGWIHTLTGQYRCSPGTINQASSNGTGLAFAEPEVSEDALESARDEAYQVGYQTASDDLHDDDDLETARTEARDEGIRQGRAEYAAELSDAITAALDDFYSRPLSTSGRAVIDALNAVLIEAWESVDV